MPRQTGSLELALLVLKMFSSSTFLIAAPHKKRYYHPTDLYIYILDAVPCIHVVSNHLPTDKLTTANGRTQNRVNAGRSPIQRSVTWLATESGWARNKHSAIYSDNLCGGFVIFGQCCRCESPSPFIPLHCLTGLFGSLLITFQESAKAV